jgi:trans-aconitate 2-methyltransferase
MTWNPSAYLKFHSARLRPAIDLLQRSADMFPNLSAVNKVVDLGCGPGNITPLLCEKFPNAKVCGVDSSKEMIDKALKSLESTPYASRSTFDTATIEDFVYKQPQSKATGAQTTVPPPSAPSSSDPNRYDLIYSNAALHWCTDHAKLLTALVTNHLAVNNGVLAIQMPDTRVQKSHTLMESAALRTGYLELIKNVRIPRVEHTAEWYFDLLAPFFKEIDIWTAEYVQQLPTYTKPTHSSISEVDSRYHITSQRHPVSDFTRSTGLMPILKALGGEDSDKAKKYLDEYDRLLQEEYKSTIVKNKYSVSGKAITLMPFKRFFIVGKT